MRKENTKRCYDFFTFFTALRSRPEVQKQGWLILKFLYFHWGMSLIFDCHGPKDKCKLQAFLP